MSTARRWVCPAAGLQAAWAVRHRPAAQQEAAGLGEGGQEDYHSYLLLSFGGSTKVGGGLGSLALRARPG